MPEPTASRLIAAGGKVLVDERDLWPDGKFVITHLMVSTKFLDEHRDVVKQLIEGHVATNDFINANPAEAQQAVSDGIGEAHRQAARRSADGRGLEVDQVPQRPDRVSLVEARSTPRRSACSSRSTSTESTI